MRPSTCTNAHLDLQDQPLNVGLCIRLMAGSRVPLLRRRHMDMNVPVKRVLRRRGYDDTETRTNTCVCVCVCQYSGPLTCTWGWLSSTSCRSTPPPSPCGIGAHHTNTPPCCPQCTGDGSDRKGESTAWVSGLEVHEQGLDMGTLTAAPGAHERTENLYGG